MALKRKISKEAFEKLSDELKAEYVEKDGEYVLDLDGDEDTGALKRAKDREAQLRRDAEKRAKEAEDRLADLEGDDARKRGDIETLEKSWKKKHEDTEAAYNEKLSKKDAFIKTSLIDNVALKIANEISTSPSLMLPHIKARLSADLDGDTPITKVLDGQGQPSAMTVEELSKEFVANKEFSAIIVGSKASGSGTSSDGKNKSSRVSATGDDGKPVPLADINPKELAEQIKASKERQE